MASEPYFEARRGTWRMRYRPDPSGPWETVRLGKQPEPWSRTKPPKKPPQFVVDRAREFAEVEYRAKHGLSAAPARAKALAAYIQDYIDTYRRVKGERSIKQLVRHTASFLTFASGRNIETVQGVTKAVCRDFLEASAERMRPTTLQTMKGFLSPIWSRAVEDGLMQVNPWSLVKVPGKKEKSKPTFWTSEEVARIALACDKPWQTDLVLVLANTGIRISAVLAMEFPWIDWTRGRLTVPAAHSKSKRAYTIALSDGARDILQRRAFTAEGDLVFPNPYKGGGIIAYDSARSAIERAIKKAGVPYGTPHDLRHSYGRSLALAGVPLTVVQSQLGHSSLSMTQVYTETGDDQAAPFMEGVRLGESPGAD